MLTSVIVYAGIAVLSAFAGFVCAVLLQEKRESIYVEELRSKEGKGLTDTWGRKWDAHVWTAEPDEFAVLMSSFNMETVNGYMQFSRRNKPKPIKLDGEYDFGDDPSTKVIDSETSKKAAKPSYVRIAERLKEIDQESRRG